MCLGIKYQETDGKERTILFLEKLAALPIRRDKGHIQWMTWGKRPDEVDPGFFPLGWARDASINAGKWNQYSPEIVSIAGNAFAVKDALQRENWIDIPRGYAIEAVIATVNNHKRLYIVTDQIPENYGWVHDRWPKLVEINHRAPTEGLNLKISKG